MGRLTVLCGMPQEVALCAAIFPSSVKVLSGSDKLNLATLVPPDTKRLLSFGLSGGLSPAIKVGGLAVAKSLVDGNGNQIPVSPYWSGSILAAGSASIADPAWNAGFVACPWYSSGLMDQGDTAQQRSDLLAKTGAWSIDDESFAGGTFAAQRGIPFAILRACSDDASETLPLAARGAIMNANGSANFGYLFKSLELDPGQLGMLMKIMVDFNTSLCTLKAAGEDLMSALIN
jgi:hypothetical protein